MIFFFFTDFFTLCSSLYLPIVVMVYIFARQRYQNNRKLLSITSTILYFMSYTAQLSFFFGIPDRDIFNVYHYAGFTPAQVTHLQDAVFATIYLSVALHSIFLANVFLLSLIYYANQLANRLYRPVYDIPINEAIYKYIEKPKFNYPSYYMENKDDLNLPAFNDDEIDKLRLAMNITWDGKSNKDRAPRCAVCNRLVQDEQEVLYLRKSKKFFFVDCLVEKARQSNKIPDTEEGSIRHEMLMVLWNRAQSKARKERDQANSEILTGRGLTEEIKMDSDALTQDLSVVNETYSEDLTFL